MNTENRLKLLRAERVKILGFGRSHLRSIRRARRLETSVEQWVRRCDTPSESPQAVRHWIWGAVRKECSNLRPRLRRLRSFDEGTLDFLDQNLMAREGRETGSLHGDICSLLQSMPPSARTVQRLIYHQGKSTRAISRILRLPSAEVYQIWQQSLLLLWDGLDLEGVETGDESFWTDSLKYLDGSATAKFVSKINSEIRTHRTRTRDYNNLRIIDGIMIEFGAGRRWDEAIEYSRPKAFASPARGPIPLATQLPHASARQTPPPGAPSPRLAVQSVEPTGARPRGTSPKQSPWMRTKATGGACLKWGTIAVALFGAIFYSARFLIARSAAQPPTFTLSGLPRVTQASETAFDGAPFTGRVLPHGSYHLTGGLLKIHTTDGISLIIEAPSRFKLHSDSQLILTQGRVVAYVPPGSPNGMEIETSRFHFRAVEGEIGVSADANFDDLLVFTGEGELDHSGDKLTPGMGLRFHQGKKTVPLLPRDEAYRFPETMPTAAPRAYGDNLVVNSSFEVGPLSRGCKSGAFYRDMPLGWFAGLLKGGAFAEAEEQHSGSVRLTSPLGGLPRPADGERYLWIERGFVGQLLHDLVPGTRYQLTVSVGCQGGALPGAGQTHDRSGGEATFRFGIWSGEEWIAEHSGQTEPGRGFTEIKLEFTCPPIRPLVPRKNEQKNPSLHSPSIILIGEKGVLYDQIVIRKLDPTAEKLVLQ